MARDVLGDGYEARTIKLGTDAHGPVTATLVSRTRGAGGAEAAIAERGTSAGSVLYVHGFTDYFFQTHVAEHFTTHGYDFHALDLRSYGRSLRSGELPNYTADLGVYDAELDAAVELIGAKRLVVLGHSTGGLIAALWADRRPGLVDALVLNSPWLDLQRSRIWRTVGTRIVEMLGERDPLRVLRKGLGKTGGGYGRSLHAEHDGEWTYDLAWKPIGGFPVRAGWIRAVRQGHAQVHRGLNVTAPVLVLRSGRSVLRRPPGPETAGADTVLDTEQIARWAPWLGREVTVLRCDGALHDIYLSSEPVRTAALDATTRWLGAHLPSRSPSRSR
ncbi:MAG: alpha/beta hydrolase [Actinomycetota bacterium]|nr:alpha/beta hydrolase [Actinomycetota bacterium]